VSSNSSRARNLVDALSGNLLRDLRLLLRPRRDVKTPVNDGRNRLNLSAEFLLDTVEVEAVVVGDEVDRESEVTVTTGTTDTVKVGLGVLGEVEVDDDVDGLNIDTTGEKVCKKDRGLVSSLPKGRKGSERTRANQVPADTVAEVVEDTVTVLLKHAGVRVEARVTEFGDLLREELDTVRRVTEDDRLIDLELRNETELSEGQEIKEKERRRTLEKRVFRQWTFWRSSRKA
jgi:hypothetical protein